MDSEKNEQHPVEDSKEKYGIPDTKISLPDAKSNLMDTESNISDAKNFLPGAESNISDAERNLPSTDSNLTDTKSSTFDAESNLTDTKSNTFDAASNLTNTKSNTCDAESNLTDTKSDDTCDDITDTCDAASNLTNTKSNSTCDAKSNLTDTKSNTFDAESNFPSAIPETPSNHPDVKSNLPCGKGELSGKKNNLPDAKISPSSSKSNLPNTKSDLPGVIDLSDPKNNILDVNSALPKTKIDHPDVKISLSSAKSNLPNTKNSIPDTKSNLPNPKSNIPDANSSNLSNTKSSNFSDTKNSNLSDTESSNLSDTESNFPGANSTLPNPKSNIPDTNSSNLPDTKSNSHGSNNTLPNTRISLPGAKSNIPDANSSNLPNTKSNFPDANSTLLNTRINLPDAKISLLNAKSSLLNAKSSFRDAKSNLPGVKVNLSNVKSNVPDAKRSTFPNMKINPSNAKSTLLNTKINLSDAKISLSVKSNLPNTKSNLSEVNSILPNTKSNLSKVNSILPNTKSNCCNTKSTLPNTKSNCSNTKSTLPDTKSNISDSKSGVLDAKSTRDTKRNLPVVPVFDASLVRRSPRAPAKVKVNFNDIFNGESVKKKRSASAGSTSSSNGSEMSPTTPVRSGPRKTEDGREIDRHCWLCHKVCEDSVCVQCPRVFHFDCRGPAHRFNDEGLCPECKLTSVDGTDLKPSLTANKLANLLPFALNRMITSAPDLKKFNYSERESKDLIRPMDLSTLNQNINEHYYKTTMSFLSDVKWISHNLVILHGASHSLSASARKFVSVCKAEMLNIEACPDCYEHAHSCCKNWFSTLCSSNHTLVWAKLKGFPFWPSKVVKVIDGVADVRFFGSHEKGKVPVNHCYRLSKENPNDKVPKTSKFIKALEELELYTKNVRKKFGPVIYYPLATVYDPGPENISTKPATRKRENVASGMSVKSKKLKSASNIFLKTPVIELNKLSEATVRISTAASSAKTIITSKQNEQVKLPLSKKQITNSNARTNSDVNNNSTLKDVSSTADKSIHKKNFMKHLELDTTPRQGISQSPSKNCNGRPSSKIPNRIIPSGKECVSRSCSTESGGKKHADEAARTKTGNSKKLTAPRDVDSVNSVPDDEHSLSSLPHRGNSAEVSEPHVQDSSTHNSDVTLSERTSATSEDVVMSGDSEDVCYISLSGGKEVPSVPNTNSEESVSGSRDEISDTVTDVLDSLQFFVESSAAEPTNAYEQEEPMYTEEQRHTDLPCVQVISPCPSSSSVLSICTQCNEVHSNQVTHSPDCGNAGDNIGPIFTQQPPLYDSVSHNEYSQEQPVCVLPLPQALDLGKYQSKMFSSMRATVEEIWHDYINTPHIQQVISSLQKEIEQLKTKYEADMKDVSENTALILESVKKSMRKEKEEAIEAVKKKCEEEKEKAIKEAKKKEWCAYCLEEANYYCCWNTCYCDYSCQEAHWAVHQATCTKENTYYDQQQQQQHSPSISLDPDKQQNQSEKTDVNCSKMFSKETYSTQQRPRGNHSASMSNIGQIPSPYQSPPHPPPFVSAAQPPVMTPNYTSNVIPSSMQVMVASHTSVGPSASPFVNRLPPPPPPAPNHQSLPFVSGQHLHQNQNAPHYQTASSQGNRVLTPVLPPHTSYQPLQYFSNPSTSTVYMAGPREVRYPAQPYM